MEIPSNKKLNIGIAGVGHMGRYHVNLLTQIVDVKNVFIFDINKEQAKKTAEEYNVIYCDTYQDLLFNVDAVVIAVPTYLHYEYTMEALACNCHVLVEKPITDTIEHAREMDETARKKNLIMHLGHVERFNGAVQEIRNLLDHPFYFQTQRIGSVSRILDVGVVLDLMIHDIDLILSFVNSKVREVSAAGQSVITQFEDYALASLYFENGVVANLTASRVSSFKARTMSISQKDSFIYLDYSSQDLMIYRNPDSEYSVSQGTIKYREENLIDRVFVHKENPLKLELEYFIAAINGKSNSEEFKNILWDSHSNLYTMEIAAEILKDIARQQKLSVSIAK